MRWPTVARAVAALAAVGAVALIALNIGSRPARVVQPAPTRIDPEARVETTGAITTDIRGVKEDYQVKAEHQFVYADGTSVSRAVEITVKDRGGRDFQMSGLEARAGKNNSSLDLTGKVHLKASDGFEIDTEEAHYTESDGLVRAPGAFSFRRGHMEGSGVGMIYDKAADLLTMTAEAHVVFHDDAGAVTTDVAGGNAALDRVVHTLIIDGRAHALRGEQTIDADRLLARLTDDNDRITFMELRGDARVAGGSAAFDSMSAASMDLAYADDGSALERVVLDGKAAVALAGVEKGAPGRQFFGDHLAFTLADGTSVTGLSGQGAVRLDLPGAPGAPRRSVTARQVAATGKPGAGLNAAAFSGGVTFQEALAGAGAGTRTARSASLRLALEQDAISRAAFGGGVTFEEQGLKAAAATADYDPRGGTLALDGRDGQGLPRVEDAKVQVSSDHIALTLDSHQMTAKGHVQTVLREGQGATGGALPGLLDRGQAARVNGDNFTYAGDDGGQAVYVGGVQLWQGETTVRASRLVLDRDSGDLDATGAARATLTLDNGALIGRADRIHYTDTGRTLEYAGPKGTAGAQLSGPQGDLRAERIVLVLAKDSQSLERMEATGRVGLKVDARTIVGTHLRYTVRDERYDVEGTPASPVSVTQGCDLTTGRALTWFRGTDRMLIDGRADARTQTKSRSGPCPDPSKP